MFGKITVTCERAVIFCRCKRKFLLIALVSRTKKELVRLHHNGVNHLCLENYCRAWKVGNTFVKIGLISVTFCRCKRKILVSTLASHPKDLIRLLHNSVNHQYLGKCTVEPENLVVLPFCSLPAACSIWQIKILRFVCVASIWWIWIRTFAYRKLSANLNYGDFTCIKYLAGQKFMEYLCII